MNMAATDEASTSTFYVDQSRQQSQVQSRPSSTMYNLQPHLMPPPTRVPWNACNMPWSAPSDTYPGIMEFNGQPIPHCSQSFSIRNVFKRKLNTEPAIKTKQHISEEKMAEHLNSMHISSDYTSHYEHTPTASVADKNNGAAPTTESMSMDADNYYNINMSPQDLEKKFKNAQRITVCEQIRKLETEPLIPKALLERMERPCTALVLWQPPRNLTNLIIPLSGGERSKDSDDEQDNNNSSLVDLNNFSGMDLDL